MIDSTSKCTNANRRYWPCAIASVVVLTFGIVVLFPRIQRYVAYSKIVSSEHASRNLAGRPKPVQLVCLEDANPINIGYAQTALPSEWAVSIARDQDAVVVRANDDELLIFMSPFYDSDLSPDGNYTEAIQTAQTEQVAMSEVFFMTSAEYAKLLERTLPKSFNMYNQNGIGLFCSEDIRGLIRFGSLDEPGNMSVEVWSNTGEVSQGILIQAETPESALKLINCVLPHLRYSVGHVPPRDVLTGMIDDALADNALFSASPEVD